MEDVLDRARSGKTGISPRIIEALFESVDALTVSLASVKSSGRESVKNGLARRLKKMAGRRAKNVKKTPKPERDGRPAATGEHPPERISHVKVPIGRLDTLMELVEELTIGKMKLDLLKEKDAALADVVEPIGRLISDLRHHVTQARLVPLAQVFERFPRMVRDLAAAQGKTVAFETAGGEIELDRIMVDSLAEPLTHLLRNAVDHGIWKRGFIRLAAVREKDAAAIVVEDDGRGIDWKKVVASAEKKGMLDSGRAATLSKTLPDAAAAREAASLLLRGGLSTKEEVTETSGRGVGLSIVKDFADRTGGRLAIESPAGKSGSRFRLEVPMTLAVINALLVEAGRSIYAIPFSVIERIATVGRTEVKSMADYDVAILDDQDAPIARLGSFFNRGIAAPPSERPPIETLVIVRRGYDRVAVAVDRLLSEQEIVLKPLPPLLKNVKGFSGSTVLGDGRLALVIDANSLLEDADGFSRIRYAA